MLTWVALGCFLFMLLVSYRNWVRFTHLDPGHRPLPSSGHLPLRLGCPALVKRFLELTSNWLQEGWLATSAAGRQPRPPLPKGAH